MTYNPEFGRPSENDIENAAVALQIIEETAKLSGLLSKSVMETTKDTHLVTKLIEVAILKAEKQLAAIGYDSSGDLKETLANICENLTPWNIGDEIIAEQEIDEYFHPLKKQADQVEEDAPSHSEEMRRGHGTHHGL